MTRFGRWDLLNESIPEGIGDVDNSQYQTFTVVARFDESARAQLAVNPSDGAANVALCVFEVYLNRNFSAPAMRFNNTGFFGWDTIDADGALDIGFPGPSAGQVTVDWVRWGNGVILDSRDPGATETPTLSLQSTGTGVRISWAHGTLESASQIAGPWGTADVGSSPANVPVDQAQRFFRVRQ
jgi:hypothetical protein